MSERASDAVADFEAGAVDRVIAEYMRRLDRGESVDREELIGATPSWPMSSVRTSTTSTRSSSSPARRWAGKAPRSSRPICPTPTPRPPRNWPTTR